MIDLHAHTHISDGTASPKDIIRMAKEAGLSAIAITDHDTIDGLAEAQQEANRLAVNFVNGIEFSATFGDNRLIHILGLGLDISNEQFLQIYTQYRKTRANKLSLVFDDMRAMGVHVTTEDVTPFITGEFMDRQALAKYLVAKGYTNSVRESWKKYLDKIDYYEGELIHPQTAFEAIHAAGGKAFLAHYHLKIGLNGYSGAETQTRLQQLKDWGLDGMEAYYPSFSEEDQARCFQIIQDFDFIASGGTDFHGENRPHIQLGIGEGNFHVPDEILEEILPGVFK